MNGRFVPDASRAASSVDVNIPLEDNRLQQQQHQQPGSPRRESSYSNSMAQRFDGPNLAQRFDGPNLAQRFDGPDLNNNMNRSHAPLARSNDHVTMPASQKPHMQQQQQSSQNNNAIDLTTTSNNNHRSRTPPPNNPTSAPGGGASILKSNQANIVPQSPTSPPAAKPSSYALAVSRMIEMNADMQFAYAKLMMLEFEHQRVEARLGALEKLSENNNNI